MAGWLRLTRRNLAPSSDGNTPEVGFLVPHSGNCGVRQALTQAAKAYFDEALEQAFWIVDRPWFEERLLAHWNGSKPDDTTWFALRNVVWALGSQIALSKSSSYSFALRSSWAFFEKVLSMHAEIIFCSSSLVSAQILILMVRWLSESKYKLVLLTDKCRPTMWRV